MQKDVLQLSGGKLQYHQFGTGSTLWIAFPGFAQEGTVYTALAQHLPQNTSLIAFDLPWHGGSDWLGASFSIKDIVQALDQLLQKKQQTRYTALGFSFGARLCLALATEEAKRWDRLILLAPDGLPHRGWYHFFDQIPLLFKKRVVKLFAYAPALLSLAKRLYDWKLLDGFNYRFLRLHLQSATNRKRLAGFWLSIASFPTLRQNCQRLAEEINLPMQLITGDEDQVIPQSAFAHLALCTPQLQWIKIAQADHDLLNDAVVYRWIGFIQ